MILKKIGTEYKLYEKDDSCVATTQESPYKRLSKQNCDEIFGVVDVEKLACDECHIDIEAYKIIQTLKSGKSLNEHGFEALVGGFIKGFNKAIELNKDKLFTEFDIIKAFEYGWNQRHFDKTDENELREIQKRFIQSLQQLTEIEVEIEMETIYCKHGENCKVLKFTSKSKDPFCYPYHCDPKRPLRFDVPYIKDYCIGQTKNKLDENGCLILKKK